MRLRKKDRSSYKSHHLQRCFSCTTDMAFRLHSARTFRTGETILEQHGGVTDGTMLTLDKDRKAVAWYTAGGMRLIKRMKFGVCPLDAKLCQFRSVSGSSKSSHPTDRAIAVLLPSDDLHICMASGETYDIHIPCPVTEVISVASGLLFQRDCVSSGPGLQFLWLSSPLAPFSIVDNHESMVELLSAVGNSVVCSDASDVVLYSQEQRTLNIVQVKRLSDSVDPPALLSLRSTAVGPNMSLSEVSSLDQLLPTHRTDNSATQAYTTGYRSPMVLSRETSPAVLHSGSGVGHSAHRANEAALQSLLQISPDLTPASVPGPAVPLQRSVSHGGLSSAIRSQPLLYSRGSSGGSSNSNTALHIRKKRAAAVHSSPHGSPRPSPSGFMFDSHWESLGVSGGMDVDVSRQGPAVSSPRGSGSKASFSADAGFGDFGNIAGTPEHPFGPDPQEIEQLGLAPSEVYLTRTLQLALPCALSTKKEIDVAISGADGAVGGRTLHILDRSSGLYFCYLIKRAAPESELGAAADSAVDESKSFVIHQAQPSAQEYTTQLLFTNFVAGIAERPERIAGMALVSVPLTATAVTGPLALDKTLPSSLRNTLSISLTLLMTPHRTLRVMSSGVELAEVPLQWCDDLVDLRSGNDPQCVAKGSCALSSLCANGSHLAVMDQAGTHTLQLSSLLDSTGPSGQASSALVDMASEAVTAVVYSMHDLASPQLVEIVLEMILKTHKPGENWDFLGLLSASCGVSLGAYRQYLLSQATVRGGGSTMTATLFAQAYENHVLDCTSYYTQTGGEMCIGVEIFRALHSAQQDVTLRLGDRQAQRVEDVLRLRQALRSLLELLQTSPCSEISDAESMKCACRDALQEFLALYFGENPARTVSPLLCSNSWLTTTMNLLDRVATGDCAALDLLPVFTLPFPVDEKDIRCCRSILLSSRLLAYIARVIQPAEGGAEKDCKVKARDLLDAYVYSVHAVDPALDEAAVSDDDHNCDWVSTLAFYPPALRALLTIATGQCQDNPNPRWPRYLFSVVGRQDLTAQAGENSFLRAKMVAQRNGAGAVVEGTAPKVIISGGAGGKSGTAKASAVQSDGLAELEAASHFRFTEDDRVHEVCRLLRSSQPLYLKFEKPPEVSELDHRVKLQLRLLNLVKRSIATPVGRGMATIASLEPFMAEALPIPPLSQSGRIPPANSIITLDTTNAHADLTLWPDFHNGVAAALRVRPAEHASKGGAGAGVQRHGSSRVTRNWIMYNRIVSQSRTDGEAAHAGFLLGLGLLGHLTQLTLSDAYDYLKQGHEPTTIALLIGSAASKVGSADPRVFKMISLYMPALLPAPHGDIEIAPAVQAAGLLGLGLLYCSSGHRMMAEFLLAEMSRSPASDRCEGREAQVTAAAWSLGLVLLGKGGSASSLDGTKKAPAPPATPALAGRVGVKASGTEALRGLQDLRVESRLFQFIDGGKRPGESALFPSHPTADISSRSSRILEGADINTNITAPGAMIALGLIFIRTQNADVLQRLALPTTTVALEAMWSDLLLYRATACCLVQWSAVVPSVDWINAQIPSAIMKVALPGAPVDTKANPKLLYQTARKLNARTALSHYFCAITGYSFGIALIYAGTADEAVKHTILTVLKHLQSYRDNKSGNKTVTLDKVLRSTIEMCTCTVALSLGIVMAGSGDLDALRIMRELRWKVDDVSYGSHMALSMAIGMVFLGGGDYSLRRDPLSTACLLMACLPKYPQRTVEQQYHLQAARHLYVLATEPRALRTVDVDTGLTVNVDVALTMVSGEVRYITAPGLLPELATIRSITVAPPSLWNESSVGPKPASYLSSTLVLNERDKDEDGKERSEELKRAMLNRGRMLRKSGAAAVPILYVKKSTCGGNTEAHSEQLLGLLGQESGSAGAVVANLSMFSSLLLGALSK